MRIAFLGTPDFAIPTLAALIEAGWEIACVYSQPPTASGRGQAPRPSPVHAFAQARGLTVSTPSSLRAPEAVAKLRDLALDAAVVVAFGQILSRAALATPRLGCFNLHASLLPRWRGAAPIQRAIMAGDTLTGVSVMRMTRGLDEGPILAQARLAIGARDTAGAVHDRLALAGADLMVETLAALARGEAVERPQASDGVTYARKLEASETPIRWESPSADVDRQIRGLSPSPGAWFTAPSGRGPVRVKALLSRVEAASGEPGASLDDGLLIACGVGAVRILAAQREGRAAQDAAAFLRGFPLPAGVRLA
jgi:methionyl-tRNA formyltransferase